MSRNVRHKTLVTPTKTPSRKNSRHNDNSSDDDYAGVDLISDSEEEEPDVEVAEERAIIDSAEDDDEDLQATPRPSNDDDDDDDEDDDESSWNGFEPETDEDYLGAHNPFFDEQFDRTHSSVRALFDEDENVSPTRRVRFDLSDSNSGDSDSDIDGLFPDIFLPQDRLDPGFRRLIERDEDQNSSGNDSYWDVNNSDENSSHKRNGDTDSDSDSESTGSSGYDSEGETTDEDLPPAAKYAPAKSVLRRASEESSESEEEINPRRGPMRRGPRLISWVHDNTKPFAVMDVDSKKMLLFKAHKRRHSVGDLDSTPRVGLVQDIDSPGPIFSNDVTPMISNSANLMISAMSTPFEDLFHGQAIGPSEAFFPFTSVSADGTYFQDTENFQFDEDDYSSPEDFLDSRNYIEFVHYPTDEEEDAEEPSSDCPTTAGGASARSPAATSESQVHPLLNHFDSGVVGAFRKNQNRHQLLSRNAESHASLAFHGPHRPVRGIKGGRLQAANTPITPLRKQRANRNILPPADSSPLAHLTGGAMADKKRKFDMEEAVRGHKRSKSLI